MRRARLELVKMRADIVVVGERNESQLFQLMDFMDEV